MMADAEAQLRKALANADRAARDLGAGSCICGRRGRASCGQPTLPGPEPRRPRPEDEAAARAVQEDLAAYVEMATLTAASRTHLMLQLAAIGPAGVDLVVVDGPSAAMSCPMCAPWEGRVLSPVRSVRYGGSCG